MRSMIAVGFKQHKTLPAGEAVQLPSVPCEVGVGVPWFPLKNMLINKIPVTKGVQNFQSTGKTPMWKAISFLQFAPIKYLLYKDSLYF